MGQQKNTTSKAFDRIKWMLVVVSFVAMIWANRHYQNADWAIRFACGLFASIFIIGFALTTQAGGRFRRFALEARNELYKVVWPTRPEAVRMTTIVMGVVLLAALLLWALDSMLMGLIGLMTGV